MLPPASQAENHSSSRHEAQHLVHNSLTWLQLRLNVRLACFTTKHCTRDRGVCFTNKQPVTTGREIRDRERAINLHWCLCITKRVVLVLLLSRDEVNTQS